MLAFLQKIVRRVRNRFALRYRILFLLKKYLSRSLVNYVAPLLFRQHINVEVPKRHKPHLLILRYRYYSQNKAMGDSTEKFMLDGTLAASQLATFDVLCYDTDFAPSPLGDLQLLAKCDRIQPDAIILSSWWYQLHHPSIETLRFLRERWHTPLIAIWWDTCVKDFWRLVEPVLPFVDLNIVPDNPSLRFMDRNSVYFERFLPLWIPLDPGIYNCDNINRDIPVCFLGQVEGYRSNRMEYIQHILDQKIPIYLSTANRDSQPSHTDYENILKRSRMGINFSYSVDCHQLKARVFETMLCGAMLMESDNDQTSRYFVPMKDYVSFSSKNDLLEKLHYYLEHEDERAEIAARGEQKAREHYNHIEFWRVVLDRLAQIQKASQ